MTQHHDVADRLRSALSILRDDPTDHEGREVIHRDVLKPTLSARYALAAEMFPVEWSRIATKPGASKRRQQLGQRAEREVKLRAMHAEGKSCASCDSFIKKNGRRICDATSDFHGDTLAKADGLCLLWGPKVPSEAPVSPGGA